MARTPRLALLAALMGSSAVALALPAAAEPAFNRIATFEVIDNLPAGADKDKATVAEIIKATEDGRTLVYTDSPGARIGLIDIADPARPQPAGTVALGGEPTSTVVAGGKAFVGVVTSPSKSAPSGHLAVVDLTTKAVVATCDLGGQPDSLALSPDRKFIAIAIENERDEDVNDGALPQLPGGFVSVVPLAADGSADCAGVKKVDVTGLAAIAPEDPEPEFVDINDRNIAVVTLQENNHIVLVDLAAGKVVANFPAGTVDLDGIDTKKDSLIAPTDSLKAVAREPDAVKWLDDTRFATANEGDWKGGSRGFTIFSADGKVLFDSGNALDHLAMRLGHYPEKRSAAKGSEPEGIEVGTFGERRVLFVGTERASLVAVYVDEGEGRAPRFVQALPGGVAPEGLLAIPERRLFVTASEKDLREDGGIGSVVTIYQEQDAPAAYPTLQSAADDAGRPIPWGAISGAVADATVPGRLYAVTDSAYAQGRILTIDATKTPATIVAAQTVTEGGKPAKGLDLEGIALRDGGGFWLVSEGNPEGKKGPSENLLIAVDAGGAIEKTVRLPAPAAASATRFGFEGVTVTGKGAGERVWIAQQRPWKDDAANTTKLYAYSPATGAWGAVRYPLEKADKGWVGLSEITALGDEGVVVIERDNGIGRDAKVKALMFVPAAELKPAALGGDLPVVKKQPLRDLLPELAAPKGYVQDKVESFAVDAQGNGFAITDNDGVDDASGETLFLRLGPVAAPKS